MELSITIPNEYKVVGIKTKDEQTFVFELDEKKPEKRPIGFLAYELEKPKKRCKSRKTNTIPKSTNNMK